MKRIKIYGVGGQGVVTAAKLLCSTICQYEGGFAKMFPAYGHERRGAPIYADVVVDNQPVLLNCFVTQPDIVLLLDPDIERKGRRINKGIGPDCLLAVNTSDGTRFSEAGFERIYHADAYRLSREMTGSDIPNLSMLGVLARTGLYGIDHVCNCVEDYFHTESSRKYRELVRRSYDYAEVN